MLWVAKVDKFKAVFWCTAPPWGLLQPLGCICEYEIHAGLRKDAVVLGTFERKTSEVYDQNSKY